MIVVDGTVLADHAFGDDMRRAACLKLQEIDPEWITLALARFEIGNVAWKMARFGGVATDDAIAALRAANRLVGEFVDSIESAEVLELGCETGLTFYDASYVWLARSRGLELRTRDKEILKQCPDVARPMPGGDATPD